MLAFLTNGLFVPLEGPAQDVDDMFKVSTGG
jgi:hypothetical protein